MNLLFIHGVPAVDTTGRTPQETARLIVDHYNLRQKNRKVDTQ